MRICCRYGTVSSDFEKYYDKYNKQIQNKQTYAEELVVSEPIKTPDFKKDYLIIKKFADQIKLDYKEFEHLMNTEVKSRDDSIIADVIYLLQFLIPEKYDEAIAGKFTLPINEIITFLIQLLATYAIKENIEFISLQVSNFFNMLKNFVRPEKFTRWDLLSRTTIKVMSKDTGEDKVPEVNELNISTEEAEVEDLNVPFANQFDLDNDFDNSDNV
jgi:hypothetical protein